MNGQNDGTVSPADLPNVVDDYLSATNPFADGMKVRTRSFEPDGHEVDAVIAERVGQDEWTVGFDDGDQAWREHRELSPAGPDAAQLRPPRGIRLEGR